MSAYLPFVATGGISFPKAWRATTRVEDNSGSDGYLLRSTALVLVFFLLLLRSGGTIA